MDIRSLDFIVATSQRERRTKMEEIMGKGYEYDEGIEPNEEDIAAAEAAMAAELAAGEEE